MDKNKKINRREFLKLSALALGGLALGDRIAPAGAAPRFDASNLHQEDPPPEFPEGKTLGRICAGQEGAFFDIKTEPYWDAPSEGKVWRDEVLLWKKEIITSELSLYDQRNQLWIETDKGYIYSNYIQKVEHKVNSPVTEFPQWPSGEVGMWVEITTPYTPINLVKPKDQHQYWIKSVLRPRLYYSQVFWAFDTRVDPNTGNQQYCLMQRIGSLPDIYWVDATVCRQITEEEIAPINLDAEDKHIVVDMSYQTLSCYEGDKEVFFAKITSGGKTHSGKWLTPVGIHTIWRKMLSTHMSGEPPFGDYDIPGIPWTTLFGINGEAIHSTFWHNNFGNYGSHGCVNARPADAKWIWRWTKPEVSYDPGDIFVQGMNKSTTVEVIGD